MTTTIGPINKTEILNLLDLGTKYAAATRSDQR